MKIRGYDKKKKRERTTCGYCRGSHIYKYLFINNMDIMTKLLEDNHISLPEFAKRWEHKQGNGKVEHTLGAWVIPNCV